jgi:hypothetical protein
MENLYDYGFWYNSYEELWYAIPRSTWTEFFSGVKPKVEFEDVMSSRNINDLIGAITNPELIEWDAIEVDEDVLPWIEETKEDDGDDD